MSFIKNFAVIVPMANEEKDFYPFVESLAKVLGSLKSGTVYFIVDNVSVDRTFALCKKISKEDSRFITIWAPENNNVVCAYLIGYKEALKNKHDVIIEMDAGLSHNPNDIPLFLEALKNNECVFGSRLIKGGHITSNVYRKFLSVGGTIISNILLGTNFKDATSGFQGFHAEIVDKFLNYNILSKAHFYQTELKYLLRKKRYVEIPIIYRSPSPSVSKRVIFNSIFVLMFYFYKRITLKAKIIQ